MTLDYRKKYGDWALVVGASEGLGAALAEQLAQRGMNLAIVARRVGLLEDTAARLRERYKIETKPISCDAARPDFIEVVERGLDGVEISMLIYNCAAEHGGEFLNVTPEEHKHNIAVNCITPTLLAHHFGGKMVTRRRGGMVFCSSLAGEQGSYNWVTYGAAKSYEAIMGEGLWDEWRDYGVDACCLMVGSTYTPNFVRAQKLRGTVFAETRTPKGLPEGAPFPQTPEDAAEHLFAQLDRQWIPKVYANPNDQARYRRIATMERVDVISTMGQAMRTVFRGKPSVREHLVGSDG